MRPTFRTYDEHPEAHIDHPRAGDDILWRYYRKKGTYAGAVVYIKPNVCIGFSDDTRLPTYTCVDKHPKAKIKHGPAQDDSLNRYYSTHTTFAGALVYIQPNGVNKLVVDPPSVDDTQPWEAWKDVYQ